MATVAQTRAVPTDNPTWTRNPRATRKPQLSARTWSLLAPLLGTARSPVLGAPEHSSRCAWYSISALPRTLCVVGAQARYYSIMLLGTLCYHCSIMFSNSSQWMLILATSTARSCSRLGTHTRHHEINLEPMEHNYIVNPKQCSVITSLLPNELP